MHSFFFAEAPSDSPSFDVADLIDLRKDRSTLGAHGVTIDEAHALGRGIHDQLLGFAARCIDPLKGQVALVQPAGEIERLLLGIDEPHRVRLLVRRVANLSA